MIVLQGEIWKETLVCKKNPDLSGAGIVEPPLQAWYALDVDDDFVVRWWNLD